MGDLLGMLQARRQPVYFDSETSTYMPVQAAHNLAAMHYASRLNTQDSGGKGTGIISGSGSPGANGAPAKWAIHPSLQASVAQHGNVLMQSVEPLEDCMSGVSEVMPMPNRAAPSATEVKMVLARRRMLDREREQQRYSFNAPDSSSPDQPPGAPSQSQSRAQSHSQTRVLGEAGQESGAATAGSYAAAHLQPPQEDCGTSFIQYQTVVDTAAASAGASAAAIATSDLVPESSQDSRLVLPVLASLINLRKSRLNRTAPPGQQQPQQRHPTMSYNGGSGNGGDGTYSGSAAVGSTKAAGAGAKSIRRFAPPPSGGAAATTASGGVSTAPVDGAATAAATASKLQGGLPGALLLQQQQPALSQFPGPWRATRKWDTCIFDAPGGSALLAAASAAAAAANAGGGGGSVSATLTSRGVAMAAAPALAVGLAAHSPGTSWLGNEQPTPGGSFTAAAAARPGLVAAAAAAAAVVVARSPGGALSPPPPLVAAADAGTITGTLLSGASDVSASRVSPTSFELGRSSSMEEGGDSGSVPRLIARQRSLLREWQDWRTRGGQGPPVAAAQPAGIDEETDSLNADEDEGSDDDAAEGLLLGIPSPANQRSRPKSKVATAGDDGGDATDDDSPGGLRKTWRRTRRITQCLDVMGGGEGRAPTAPPPGRLAAPPTLPLSPPSSAAPGFTSASLSPMASRRRDGGDGGGARRGMASLALPVWLNRAFGGGSGGPNGDAGAAAAAATMTTAGEEGFGGGGAAAATIASGGRVPPLTSAKHTSFTSKFNRFKERFQILSHGQAPPSAEAAARPRVASSNDGRGGGSLNVSPTAQDSPQFLVRQTPGTAPPVAAHKGAAGAATAVPGVSGSRPSNRHSVESRAMSQQASSGARGRFTGEPTSATAAGVVAVAVVSQQQQQQQGLQDSLVITNTADRNRQRGEASFAQFMAAGGGALMPTVRLL